MNDNPNADRRMTYVLECDDDEEKWFERTSYPSSRRASYVPVPSSPPPGIDSDDSFVDGWFV